MSERQALGRERAASLSANCNLTPVQKCQPDYMRSRRRLRHREGSGEERAGARTKPVSAEAKLRGRSERRLRRSKGSAKWRLRETKAPAKERSRCRSEAVPERSGAGAKQVPERSRCRPKGLASRRSERSISKGRKAATAFSSQVRAAPREERAGQPATSVRLRAVTAPAKVRSRCRNEAVPGARKTDGRESGRADRSSPLSPPFGRAGGRYRWHRIYRRADGASFRS